MVRVRGLLPPGLPELLRVRGLGPKRVRTLWRELNIESPADLRRAADDGSLLALRGFGAKMVERVVSGLDYLEQAPAARSPAAAPRAMPKAPKSAGRLLAGTSGYSYPQWKGGFYPQETRSAEFLAFYAGRLTTVEINNTFYHFPSQKAVDGWIAETPARFRFALKAHRRITHHMRLGPSARDEIVAFVERCAQLGPRLGCILFQLPPNFSRDDARLEMLLATLPAGPRYAVEFRHESWFADDVLEKLRQHNVACVASDSDDRPQRECVTADFVYARLRRSSYTDTQLDAWQAWFQAQLKQKRDVLAYLKHDEAGAAPEVVLARLAQTAPTSAREVLGQTLASPVKRAPKRGRKTG
jgi:uncharacterized protein YecE (DUF72 family)